MDEARPDPDRILEKVQRDEDRERRGKLKIFFGASAGVGKTYAMLSAAREDMKNGVDVVVGVAETHGRKETAALLEGLEILPAREIEYQGRILKEFDLDGALQRRPQLFLIDELAHSNAPESRHPKRWQDVEELLRTGVNVYSTLNVQHLESLNGIVGGITGIRVWETVPDGVFDKADDVVLVDLPPDELLRRLKEGKVYQPKDAERALRNFFNKGNLIALRELSLRRTADRVDVDVRTFRSSQSIHRVRGAREILLVGVGPGEDSENVVRAAARLADRLDASWHAVCVRTPMFQALSDPNQRRVAQALKLAQELGAETATVEGLDVAETLAECARSRNVTKVLIGRGTERASAWIRRLLDLFKISVSARLTRLAPECDLIRVAAGSQRAAGENQAFGAGVPPIYGLKTPPFHLPKYFWAAAGCAMTTTLASLLYPYFDLANIVMLFLLSVVLVALRLGRGPAVLSAFLSVGAFDFFFVPPFFTFSVSDAQYVLTFAVMLSVALITGQLTANLRYQARAAAKREARSRALYEMARELSGALVREQVAGICDRFMRTGFHVNAAILLPDSNHKIVAPGGLSAEKVQRLDLGVAQWALDHGKPAGSGTHTLPGTAGLYLPLNAPMRRRGVLAIEPETGGSFEPEQIRHIEAAASLIAIALERVHYVEVAQDALLRMESERLRNSLLSALSHDIRTPLTSLVGLADTLNLSPEIANSRHAELVSALRDEAQRMNRLVNNLLDMARFTSGKIQLRLEWQPVEEIVGSALHTLASILANHKVRTAIPATMPLIRFDAVLIERVLCNLLENAVKYAPPGSEIDISAATTGTDVEVAVKDNGPGIPAAKRERIFDKFTRGDTESPVPGVGLGLSICRTIIEAHGGKIRAEAPVGGGARFVFTLPLGTPPEFKPDKAENSPENA